MITAKPRDMSEGSPSRDREEAPVGQLDVSVVLPCLNEEATVMPVRVLQGVGGSAHCARGESPFLRTVVHLLRRYVRDECALIGWLPSPEEVKAEARTAFEELEASRCGMAEEDALRIPVRRRAYERLLAVLKRCTDARTQSAS